MSIFPSLDSDMIADIPVYMLSKSDGPVGMRDQFKLGQYQLRELYRLHLLLRANDQVL